MILDELNESQRAAVCYIDGPQLVIAGAGSGKTRVLTYKIAYLLEMGFDPWSIMALTFTNKAANEMKQRIGNLVGMDKARYLRMGTFHSIFSHILRVEAEAIGYTSNYTIYDEADSLSLLKAVIKDMGLDEDKAYAVSKIKNIISSAKNHLVDSEKYAANPRLYARDSEMAVPRTGKIFAIYEQRCRQSNAMDFDDLLLKTYQLFAQNEDIRRKYADMLKYILVDEYQDTNNAQQQIINLLTKEQRHICVVGDDAQSIYSFRGANVDNILNFNKIYPESKLFKLEQNYRSTQNIVKAANSLIKHNDRQIPKDVYSENSVGEKVSVKSAYSDREEAAIVANEIYNIKRQDKCEYSDFAILYRTNAQSRSFEDEFRSKNIPYRIYGGLSFYQRKEIKDTISYFRAVVNNKDEEALKRIIKYPKRGIGDTTINNVLAFAHDHSCSMWEAITQEFAEELNVNKGTKKKLLDFCEMINGFTERLNSDDAYTLGQAIIKESGIFNDIYCDNTPEGISRQENLQELVASLKEFVESKREENGDENVYLTDFLQEVALISDLDKEEEDSNRVTLMTIHAAKGLEFPTVFVVGLEENLFPSQRSLDSLRQLEEERRLLYVAITRAERHCILTNAKMRYKFGSMDFNTPSRFIKDIDPEYLDIKGGNNIEASKSSIYHNGYGNNKWSNRMQNSRPVATQFMADAKPKCTSPKRAEQAVDPFSDSFKRKFVRLGGNMSKFEQAMTNGGRTIAAESTSRTSVQTKGINLSVNDRIEHRTFGQGVVTKIEGSGENTKATVKFDNVGEKTLLLKFARFNKV